MVAVLQNCSTVSQPEYWYWYSLFTLFGFPQFHMCVHGSVCVCLVLGIFITCRFLYPLPHLRYRTFPFYKNPWCYPLTATLMYSFSIICHSWLLCKWNYMVCDLLGIGFFISLRIISLIFIQVACINSSFILLSSVPFNTIFSFDRHRTCSLRLFL